MRNEILAKQIRIMLILLNCEFYGIKDFSAKLMNAKSKYSIVFNVMQYVE